MFRVCNYFYYKWQVHRLIDKKQVGVRNAALSAKVWLGDEQLNCGRRLLNIVHLVHRFKISCLIKVNKKAIVCWLQLCLPGLFQTYWLYLLISCLFEQSERSFLLGGFHNGIIPVVARQFYSHHNCRYHRSRSDQSGVRWRKEYAASNINTLISEPSGGTTGCVLSEHVFWSSVRL